MEYYFTKKQSAITWSTAQYCCSYATTTAVTYEIMNSTTHLKVFCCTCHQDASHWTYRSFKEMHSVVPLFLFYVYHISFKNITINLLLNKVNPLACATVMTYSISGGFNTVAYQYITYIFNLFVHKKIIKLFETKHFISPCPCTTAALMVIPKTNLSKRCWCGIFLAVASYLYSPDKP